MPKKTRTAATPKQQTKPPHMRYLFIVDDLVIAKTNDLSEAIRFARKHPEAELREQHSASDLDSLLSHRRYEKKRAKEVGNPVGEPIKEICGLVLYSIGEMISDALPGGYLEDGCWGDGRLRSYTDNKRHERRATIAECCRYKGTVSAEITCDVRKPMPPQIAASLRKLSELMLQAADDVLCVEDDRNMKLLNKVITDPGYLDRLWKQRKEITYGGDIEPIEDYRLESLAKARGEKGGVA